MRYVTLLRSAARELFAGRAGAADRLNGEAFALGVATGQPDVADACGLQLLHLRHEQDRLAEIAPAIERIDLLRDHPLPAPIVSWASALLGDVDRAHESLTIAVDAAPRLAPDEFELAALTYASLAASLLGRIDAATELLPRVEPHRGQHANAGAVVMPVVEHMCGLLHATVGALDAARADLVSALELHRERGAPTLAAASEAALMSLDAGTGPGRP